MAFTYFFRDREVLDLVVQYALPDLKTRMYINIWDAGCAMGPEPYSLAILLRENMGKFMFRNVHIYATDIDENGELGDASGFGEIIANGIYAEQDVKRIPAEILERYFTRVPTQTSSHHVGATRPALTHVSSGEASVPEKVSSGIQGSPLPNDHYQISDEMRKAVHFQKHDLCSLQPIRDGFGLIVCKNVLLHLTPEMRVAVLKMFYAALGEGGFLVTEQTQKLPPEIEPLFRQVTAAGQLFQKN
jgi:chemotaxis protein methyltransferase CheR